MDSYRNEDNKFYRGLNVTTLIKLFDGKERSLLIHSYLKNNIVKEDLYSRSYEYKSVVEKRRLQNKMGVFYDYFIRLYLSMLNNIRFKDDRCVYIRSKLENIDKDKAENNNEKRENSDNNEGKDIDNENRNNDDEDDEEEYTEKEKRQIKRYIECYNEITSQELLDKSFFLSKKGVSLIWNMAQLHLVFFGHGSFELKENRIFVYVDIKNLEELTNILDKNFEHKTKLLLNPAVGGFYFAGDADLIIDDTLIDIKCTKKTLVNKKLFLQHLIYAFGYYKNCKETINKLVIFNPLLGTKHSLDISVSFDQMELDFFEKYFDLENAIEKTNWRVA